MLRHALSAIFGDMPNTEYAALLKSVQDNGFTHPEIITYEGKILDGWHRYRVAQHLGIESDLVFEELSGVSPAEFVLAENLYRRHLTVSQRSQMVVEAHEWVPKGTNRFTVDTQNCASKTKKELAEQANVSPRSIDTAKQVSRAGRSEEVISGEKSASAVIAEEREKAAPVEHREISEAELAYDGWLGDLSDVEMKEMVEGMSGDLALSVLESEFEKQTGLKLPKYKFNLDATSETPEVVDALAPELVSEPTSEPTLEPKPETASEPTEGDFLRVVLDSDMVIHDNALAMSSGILRKMPDMSAEGWKALRRNVLRVIHPDKVDMSEWTDAEKDSWTVLFEFMNDFLGELERDYREYASVK